MAAFAMYAVWEPRRDAAVRRLWSRLRPQPETSSWQKSTRGAVFIVTGAVALVMGEWLTGELALFISVAIIAGVVSSESYAHVSGRLASMLSDRTVVEREETGYPGDLGEDKLALAWTGMVGALVGCVFALLTRQEIVNVLGAMPVSWIIPLTFLAMGGAISYNTACRAFSKEYPMAGRIGAIGVALTAAGVIAAFIWPLARLAVNAVSE